MRTFEMINLADNNGKTYTSIYGTYSKTTGFTLKFDPHPTSFSALINKLFHDDCWTVKVEKKKLTKADIEKALGYEIEIEGYEPVVKLTELEQQAVDHLLNTFSDLIRCN